MLTEEEFARTVRTYMDTVYRVAYNCLRDGAGAEDVCQEVFLRLYRSGPAFQSEEHRKRWLIRVAINEARRTLASPWRRTASLDELPAEAAAAAPPGDDTLPLVMSLPKKYRVVLYLYYYEGYTAGEIAALLRIPAATVRSQLDRGRKRLKQLLQEAENV